LISRYAANESYQISPDSLVRFSQKNHFKGFSYGGLIVKAGQSILSRIIILGEFEFSRLIFPIEMEIPVTGKDLGRDIPHRETIADIADEIIDFIHIVHIPAAIMVFFLSY
jgi:hypothetical protein